MKNASPVADTIVLNANKAYELFTQLAAPECVLTEVGYPEFLDIYSGEGLNEPRSPLGEIMSEDFVYMLFAMTLGENASSQISDLFQNGNHLLGHFLDEICSIGIEVFADDITGECLAREVSKGTLYSEDIILRYSPGYCGWHITGQKILHQYLNSGEIGIRLTENYYMKPIKSISGVMIGSNPDMQYFKNNYSFCCNCLTKNCRKRLAVN